MAIFHLNAKIISRGKGQSAIAAAAYRSGERLRDEQAGELKVYAARADRILFSDIMAPKDAPEWAHDRNRLWNEAERAEKRKDAQLAREIEVALPCELTQQEREWLVKDFAREAFVRKGYVVDIAIHAPDGDADHRNHHAHIMVTRRTLGPDGFASTKDWQFDKKQLAQWREDWANLANRHLERHGHQERIDHRSLAGQGVDREATVHIGYAAAEMTQRGAPSDRMDAFKSVLARNGERIELRNQMAAIDIELRELTRLQEQEKAVETVTAFSGQVADPIRPIKSAENAGLVAQQRDANRAFLRANPQFGRSIGAPALNGNQPPDLTEIHRRQRQQQRQQTGPAAPTDPSVRSDVPAEKQVEVNAAREKRAKDFVATRELDEGDRDRDRGRDADHRRGGRGGRGRSR